MKIAWFVIVALAALGYADSRHKADRAQVRWNNEIRIPAEQRHDRHMEDMRRRSPAPQPKQGTDPYMKRRPRSGRHETD